MTKTVLRNRETGKLIIVDDVSEWWAELIDGEYEYVESLSEDWTFQCVEPSGSAHFFLSYAKLCFFSSISSVYHGITAFTL